MISNDMHREIDLAGQVAIVTGGGGGIGRAIVQRLAQAGAAVAVVDVREDRTSRTVSLITSSGGRALGITTDVTDQRAVKRMTAEVEQQLGPVTLLVNDAAIVGPIGPIWEMDADAWWRCIDVNLRGPFLCAKTVLAGMIDRRLGRIVNVASACGLELVLYMSAYSVGKTALVRLTENLAAETKEHGISVFSITPGTVRTPMTESVVASEEGKWIPWLREGLEAGGTIPPERAADLVVSLASGRADALSGCFITVHDDVPEMVRRAEEIQRDELHTLRLRT
jgi:NAD(P)-dependent dehydrogenase (short-subunit alcohol dehydrogenase family)